MQDKFSFGELSESAPYALFDFDGTLSRGYISMDYLDWVCAEGLYSQDMYRQQMDILKAHNDGSMSYDDWVRDWGLFWAHGLKGQSEERLRQSALRFFEGFSKNIYPEAKQIVELLKGKGYKTVMLSAGVVEVADLARKYLGMDQTLATQCQILDGVYTGDLLTRLHMPGGKGEVINALSSANGLPSLAFGDSSGDVSMLERAKIPVCLNANTDLAQTAKERNWASMPIALAITFLQKVL